MSPGGEVEQRRKINKKSRVRDAFGVGSGKVLLASLIKVQHFHAVVALAKPQHSAAFIEAARTQRVMNLCQTRPQKTHNEGG